jgi:hypothetical protein
MSATHLVVVPSVRDGEPTTETLNQRVHRLQSEAKALAHDHVEILRAALIEVSRLASEIADGGEVYPVGAREISRRLAEEASHQSLTLGAINERAVN